MSELQKKGAGDIALELRNDTKSQIKFSNNEIAATKIWQHEYVAIMFELNKRIITSYMEEFSRKDIISFVKKAMSFAKAMEPNKKYHGLAEGPFKYKKHERTHDKKVSKIGDKSIDIVEAAMNAAFSEGAKRCNGVFEFAESEETLLTSNNVETKDKGTGLYLSFRSHVEKNASGYSNQVCRILSELKPEKSGIESAKIAVAAKDPQKIKAGKYNLIMGPYPFGDFLENVGYSARISAIESGHSFFRDKLGKKVASKEVTVYDDGTYPGGLETSKFDAEGVPKQKTLLIDKGKLKTYLHNTSTAKRYNTKTTANAGLLYPTNTNLILKKGKVSKKKIFDGFTGLHITNLWYTRFQNYLKGNFSTIPRDGIFLYKNGKLMHPVKDIRISDNMLRIFSNIVESTKEQSQHSGWEVTGPIVSGSVKIKNVNITRSTG